MIKKVLTKNGLVVYDPEKLLTIRFNREETNELLKTISTHINYTKLDDFCEVVHLELTNRCNLKCEYCYKDKAKKKDMPLKNWYKIIDSLVDYGVFQVTFGGGEPLIYKHMPQLLDYCVKKRLNVAMTTNGILLSAFQKSVLNKFRQINVSYHGDIHSLTESLRYLKINKIKAGINFVLKKEYKKDIGIIMLISKSFNVEVLFLTYKAINKDYDEMIDPREVYKIAKDYADKDYKVAIDGMTCFGNLDEFCLQKRRFADISCRGDVYPCSFIRESIGNVLKFSFSKIWRNRGKQIKCPFIK